jgi:glycosyltransferase involved in cell wall biosynthesis
VLEKHLHIISLTVPYPVDYGGVFDLFYKLPALQQQGIKIHLHCFDYGRGHQTELNKYCETVSYYQRSKTNLFSSLPYIVYSRKNEELFANLLKDDHPVLMEGIHCTYLLNDPRFANRKCIVRLHNVEHEYYGDLASVSTSPLRKLYFKRESTLLKKYERRVANKAVFISVSQNDVATYRRAFDCENITYLPLFLPPWSVNAMSGMGGYCLYQGDLSVDANAKMAKWLAKKIFAALDISLKIAGKNPPASLQKIVSTYKNVTLIADPGEEVMQELIAKAHINIVPSFSGTGIKLKLLNALYNGRHCVVNNATVEGTGFEQLCHVANTTDHLKDLVAQLYYQPFREDEVIARKKMLETHFDNAANAAKLIALTWD